ncbi:MAG: hypothetical protein CVU56_23505 [Deltaproteobacteria bacterium HGW-Deltaproteobacteria-14]|jgi:DNA-binding response OmpR family regulator|nr:MAG: hypothetical protein CVU56_23505 [Deltaproteobacteria bacterium HGW-Deltaproteobacteria-14]
MSCAIHLYHHGDRLRASLARELGRAGLAVETFASPEALLTAARATRPDAILWDVDAAPVDRVREVGAPVVLLTRSREVGAAHPESHTLVLPFERWRLTPVTAAVAGGIGPAAASPRVERSSVPRVQHDTVRQAQPSAWLAEQVDDLDALAATRPSEPTPLPAGIAPRRVLIADDDDVLQHILAYQLAEAGWHVFRASDGVAAQVALETERFDLVLLDLNLPHVNGFELLELLDLRNTTARAEQVVVMSEQAQDDKVIRAFALGAHDFLQKPLNPQVALSRFRRLLERV